MAVPVAFLVLQVALLALLRRNGEGIAPVLRTELFAVYRRHLKPWQVRAYQRAALLLVALALVHDVVFVAGTAT